MFYDIYEIEEEALKLILSKFSESDRTVILAFNEMIKQEIQTNNLSIRRKG